MLFSLAFNKIPMFRSNLLRNKLQKSSKILFSTDTFIPLPTNENNPKLVKIRHTTAHVLAMAVQKLFPDAKLATGPWIENGFYYDFFFPSRQLSDQNLKSIKKEMDKIIKLNFKISKSILTRDNARDLILSQNEPYKLEVLDSIPSDQAISLYHTGEKWWDICAGPHLESTGELNSSAIELTSVAGAYWRGDESNPMLQRIYGTAWETKEQLDQYLHNLEDAKRRDHRVLGKKLNLFSIQDEAGGGLVFWHPKGAIIRRIIEDFWTKEHLNSGYEMLYSPHIACLNLWKTSGHYDFYNESMFKSMKSGDEATEFQLKPMNCPFHCLVYKDTLRSYKQLPIRWAELGTVYRHERSGTMHGLMRVRGFTQDDAHIFCLPSQLENEIVGVLNLTEKILKKFGFASFEVVLSTRPDKSVGSDEVWEIATRSLSNALHKKNLSFTTDNGGGAFYGPKIDIKICDAIGRKWQCSTIQCDFNLPERFELEYVDSDQSRQRPIMVHRAIFGSLERFFGILIENTAGEFPLWLAPVHLRLLPVSENVIEYCNEVKRLGTSMGIRIEIDSDGNRLAKQIRNAEMEHIPLMAIVGDQEKAEGLLSLRSRKKGDEGTIPMNTALSAILRSIENCDEFSL